MRTPQPATKLPDQVPDAIRLKHYAYGTEETYVYLPERSVLRHNERPRLDMGYQAVP